MSEPFQLPYLQQGTPIVDLKTGAATKYFADWLNRTLTQIQAAERANAATISSLQAQQKALIAANGQVVSSAAAASTGQQAADQAGGTGATGGNAQGNFTSSHAMAWTHGPQVDLTAVIAGTLTIATSGPSQDFTTRVNSISEVLGDFLGNWRIQEINGAVETTVFSGTFSAIRDRDDVGIENLLWNNEDTSQTVIPRTSTGNISYRLDIIAPNFEAVSVLCYLSVRRA